LWKKLWSTFDMLRAKYISWSHLFLSVSRSHISCVWTWIQARLTVRAWIFPFFSLSKPVRACLNLHTHTHFLFFSWFIVRLRLFSVFFPCQKMIFKKLSPNFWSIFIIFISKSWVTYSDEKHFFELIEHFFISLISTNTPKTGLGGLKNGQE
jgi:hypothetical protein